MALETDINRKFISCSESQRVQEPLEEVERKHQIYRLNAFSNAFTEFNSYILWPGWSINNLDARGLQSGLDIAITICFVQEVQQGLISLTLRILSNRSNVEMTGDNKKYRVIDFTDLALKELSVGDGIKVK